MAIYRHPAAVNWHSPRDGRSYSASLRRFTGLSRSGLGTGGSNIAPSQEILSRVARPAVYGHMNRP